LIKSREIKYKKKDSLGKRRIQVIMSLHLFSEANLFSGGVIGALLGEVMKWAISTINKGLAFKCTLKSS